MSKEIFESGAAIIVAEGGVLYEEPMFRNRVYEIKYNRKLGHWETKSKPEIIDKDNSEEELPGQMDMKEFI